MAIIESARSNVHVRAQGEAMRATVNFSGALMEMLATTYSYPALAAVRESIQNACDAAGRAGKTFRAGVFVRLPTLSEPTFMVRDEGAGMSREFMEGTYLSLGSSTKSGDDGAAGGMGIGRFAAYGFARECTIATTDEHDMVERTYFQYMGEDGLPRIQFAGEAPGAVSGTKITFPVKMASASDVKRAVAWLSEIMQLTMGDTFTLENPGARGADMLSEHHSQVVLELGEVDETLRGVRVFTFTDDDLCFANGASLTRGSLIVQTNQERHVGGLPFHVHTPQYGSIFSGAHIIEVPLSMGIPFMPSREEVKYNDSFKELCERIERAACRAMLARLTELAESGRWGALAAVARLLTGPNAFAYLYNRAKLSSDSTQGLPAWEREFAVQAHALISRLFPDAAMALALAVSAANVARTRDIFDQSGARVREVTRSGSLSALLWASSGDFFRVDDRGHQNVVRIPFSSEVVLICQDVDKGGERRLRSWLKAEGFVSKGSKQVYVISAATPDEARELTGFIRSAYQATWDVLYVSDMPEVASGKAAMPKVKRAARAAGEESLEYYPMPARSPEVGSMEREVARFDGLSPTPKLYFCRGECGGIEGLSGDLRTFFKQLPGGAFQTLSSTVYGPERQGLTERVYVLTHAQGERLRNAQAEALEEDPESEESQALSSWVSVFSVALSAVKGGAWPEVLAGKKFIARSNGALTRIAAKLLCEKPRMGLIGTKISDDLLPFFDVGNGDLTYEKLPETATSLTSDPALSLLRVLRVFGSNLKAPGSGEGEVPRHAQEANELLEILAPLAENPLLGIFLVDDAFAKLQEKYPLLSVTCRLVGEKATDDFCLALARVYS